MKKIFSVVAIAAVFAACNNSPKTGINTQTPMVTNIDTAGQYSNTFNDRNQPINMNGLGDTIISSDGSQYVKLQPNALAAPQTTQVYEQAAPAPRTVARRTSTARTTSRRSSGGSGGYSNGGSYGNGTVAQAPRKRGWSKAAKGTVIGAGTGAVAGAIISKKKGKGAVIGGLIGAGGGYVIGRALDKKDGRY